MKTDDLPGGVEPKEGLGRRVQISELIAELQEIHRKFGDTCCFVTGLAWGATALWHETWADRLTAEPTPEMIEAAAKAAYDAGRTFPWDKQDENVKGYYRQMTRWAIAAYRKSIGVA